MRLWKGRNNRMKYELTENTITIGGKTLYQIKALKDFKDVKKGDLGGWIETESNLSQENNCWVYGNARVYGNAWVSGDAWVYGDARVFGNAELSTNKSYIKGWFIGGDNTGRITKLSSDEVGNNYLEAQYVLGDYEIKDNELQPTEDTIILNGKKYKLVEEITE